MRNGLNCSSFLFILHQVRHWNVMKMCIKYAVLHKKYYFCAKCVTRHAVRNPE
jgi:hypothetical protein